MADTQAETSSVPTAPPTRRVARVLARVAWTFAVLLVLAIATHSWWLAPLVARDLASHSGRDVHFDAIRLGLTPQLAPVAVLRGVHVANAPWGDTSVPFAALDEVRFEFAWHRDAGRFVVAKLVLRGGETHLERHPDGRRNWRLRQPDDRGPGRYLFDALEAHAASLTFRHPAIDMTFHAVATDAPDDGGAAPPGNTGGPLTTSIVFDGSFRGADYKGDLLTGPELTFRDTGRWFPARGSAEVAGAHLDVDGRAADMFLGARVDADATLDGRSLAALRAFARKPGAASSASREATARSASSASPRAFHVAGHVHVDPHRYALDAATATVGGTDLHGDVAWSQTGQRPMLQARLASETTDVADLLWLLGREAPVATAATESPGNAATDPFATARDLDADVAFAASHLALASARPLQSLKIDASLRGGRLRVSDLDVGWAGGHTSGHAGLDLSQPLAASSIDVQTHGVQLEALLHRPDEKKRITGTLSGTLVATATGNALAAWRDSVSGHASLAIREGTISSLVDAALGLEAGKLLRTVLSGAEALAMPCAAATVTVRGGRGTLRDLVIDSANTRTTGSGTIDLHDETIDVVLTPQPKRPGIDLDRSIRLHGRLPKPERSLVDRVAQPPVAACPATER